MNISRSHNVLLRKLFHNCIEMLSYGNCFPLLPSDCLNVSFIARLEYYIVHSSSWVALLIVRCWHSNFANGGISFKQVLLRFRTKRLLKLTQLNGTLEVANQVPKLLEIIRRLLDETRHCDRKWTFRVSGKFQEIM